MLRQQLTLQEKAGQDHEEALTNSIDTMGDYGATSLLIQPHQQQKQQKHSAADTKELDEENNDNDTDSEDEDDLSYENDSEEEGSSDDDGWGEDSSSDEEGSFFLESTERQNVLCCRCCRPQSTSRSKKRSRSKEVQCSFCAPVTAPLVKVYGFLKEAVLLVTNVDDVWDSPAMVRESSEYGATLTSSARPRSSRRDGGGGSSSDGGTYVRNSPTRVSTRHKLGVLFWFVVFATSFAVERGSFKVMVDRMGPFRMVVGAEVVVAVHAAVMGFFMIVRYIVKGSAVDKTCATLPLTDIGVIAVLDTFQNLFAVISGSHVAPILTTILVHFTIPLSSMFTLCLEPGGPCAKNCERAPDRQSSQQVFGSSLITLSTILGLAPALVTLIYPQALSTQNLMANRTAWNTILFVLSCIPGAISQMYKERALMTFAQPVDSNFLNALLSLFSFGFILAVCPLVYGLQGLADTPTQPDTVTGINYENWAHLYPSKRISDNFSDGLKCVVGLLDDETQRNGYPEEAHCDFAWGIILFHVFSMITIHHAIDKICNAGAIKILHKGISAGIILSVISMAYYQIFVDDHKYGFIPNFYHVMCAIVLLVGSEIYHRLSVELTTFETSYPEVMLYQEE